MSAQSAKRVAVMKNHPTIDRPSDSLTTKKLDILHKMWQNISVKDKDKS